MGVSENTRTATERIQADIPSAIPLNFPVSNRSKNGSLLPRLALEALILTAARSGEIRGATWGEVDLTNALWTIPAERMKAGKEHVAPLSLAALSVFSRAQTYREARSELVFLASALASRSRT